MKYYYDPQNRLPYKKRLRNRCIAIAIFVAACALIGSCIFKNDEKATQPRGFVVNGNDLTATSKEWIKDTLRVDSSIIDSLKEAHRAIKVKDPLTESAAKSLIIGDARATTEAAPEASNSTAIDTAGTSIPENDLVDSVHIKKQKDLFLAQKIDNMLRRFKPMYGVVLVVDPKSNEIIAWGETKDYKVQNEPDFFVKNTFPAASLAKTITIAAAMDANRYSLNTPVPMLGASHTLYKRQLRVPENYHGTTISLADAYAKSANPPLALIGMDIGAKRLREAARNLGYNMNFPGGIPGKSSYAPPDTGYGLAEASCGFTEATTLTPLLAAAQVRSILTKKPLEIPWAENIAPYAPKSRIALDVKKFNEKTYYGLRMAMIRSITNGTARKQISTRNMARKNFAALDIGGKTGSLDGQDPHGRYEWFMGFAQSKENPDKAVVVVVMQVHDLQGYRSQPATQVAAMIMNYWAHQNLWPQK
ncbi:MULTISPECIES: penicillin-binding transpeptidase domain-containing protein [unclassified Fibrobacter]|uniref:penicillin-binding transpeptidase domain-containing protein n=1 Tax=unclassified Fibrobacter TaxID=2634177 RepID=UPI0025BBA495|nr:MULTISPECIES: penicillin-binding transpeptidase domain-containing protein [unclassified Fibrobacter]